MGIPELFASELSQNLSMRHDVRNKLLNGLAEAEGGGFMYLGKAIKNIKEISTIWPGFALLV